MARARSFVWFLAAAAAACVVPACSGDPSPGADPGGEGGTVDPGGPSCNNGVKDGDEVGIDCGGICKKCTGEPCDDSSDCKSDSCTTGICGAQAGKPCGVGVATLCDDGQDCEQDGDCKSNKCDGGKCVQPPPSATDGKKNNDETDVDCGGPNAPPCPAGKGCLTNDDCVEKYCPDASPKVCVTPRADDGVQNGTETDVDCGGQSGVKCTPGKKCLVDNDCTAACNYAKVCVESPSCKPHFGGDTCGTKPAFAGEPGDAAGTQESCCRSLEVPGYTAPGQAGKKVYLDKYEITAGRMRAFIEAVAAQNGGKPNIKAWVAANTPPIWNPGWNKFLATDTEADSIALDHPVLNPGNYTVPSPANAGQFYTFGSVMYVYVHGNNCFQGAGSYGFPTFFYPADVMTKNGGLARAVPQGLANAKDYLDAKSMNCAPSAIFAAFCHWDGGQLATDEVLDTVTNTTFNPTDTRTCGSRCAALANVQATSDSGSDTGLKYFWPFYPNGTTHEGVSRVASPGRVATDVVRINPADEPWMDLHGNMNELALNMTGATFTGQFVVKYRGIGYNSARALRNTTAFTYPEYKAAYTGARCMRFK